MNRLPDRRRARVLPENPLRAAIGMLVFLAVLYAVQLLNASLPGVQPLSTYGILPRRVDGLDGILFAPLLHASWAHLISNTLPLLVLGWLVLAGGARQFTAVTATVWLIAGLGTWLVGSGGGGVHIGASSLVFGWMVFLLLRGFLLRSIGQILVAVVLFFYWGSMLWGVLPGQPGISWEGHLFGACGGLLAAWLVARAAPPRPSAGSAGKLAA
ncbi:rhomboid family intramembrane serine protease [Saccharopolyspora montiporae]|uniref:rhomboid family intramembrane serine protease n=1 Tax=Saccharopolyspora montiporae TaxID=2781240 RepID=UPI00351C4C21